MKIKLISILFIMLSTLVHPQNFEHENSVQQKKRQITDPELAKFLGIPFDESEVVPKKENSTVLGGSSLGYSGQNKLGNSKYDADFNPGLDFYIEENPYEADRILNDAIDEHRAQKAEINNKINNKVIFTIWVLIGTIFLAYLIFGNKK